jgi:predicted ArsR family transcriptional regulator
MLKHDSTPAASALLTDVILLIFRVNGQLLVAGDRLVEHLHLTSARWQMLGAVALSPSLRTAPQLAAAMGVTRQGAQKQLNLLLETGLVEAGAQSRTYAVATLRPDAKRRVPLRRDGARTTGMGDAIDRFDSDVGRACREAVARGDE